MPACEKGPDRGSPAASRVCWGCLLGRDWVYCGRGGACCAGRRECVRALKPEAFARAVGRVPTVVIPADVGFVTMYPLVFIPFPPTVPIPEMIQADRTFLLPFHIDFSAVFCLSRPQLDTSHWQGAEVLVPSRAWRSWATRKPWLSELEEWPKAAGLWDPAGVRAAPAFPPTPSLSQDPRPLLFFFFLFSFFHK